MKAIKVAFVSAAGFSAMVAVVAGVQTGSVAADDELKAEAVADANGNLHVPGAYRNTYQFLGTWAVAADQGQGSEELHVVYASPGTIAAYRKDGHFPDGTVLVKEVYRAATKPMTTGTVSHADSLRGWFVMMKDSSGRYPGNNLWGDGWGWSWFDAANPSTPSVDLPLKGGKQSNVNRLPCTLQTLSSAGTSVGLHLCRWVPAAEALGVGAAGRGAAARAGEMPAQLCLFTAGRRI